MASREVIGSKNSKNTKKYKVEGSKYEGMVRDNAAFLLYPILYTVYRIPNTRMHIKPLSNHLFIEPIEAETMTKSGIYIPESAENKPTTGKVIAVGEGKINEKGERTPMSVKIGDTVLYKKYGLSEVEIDGKKYIVGDEDSILAILE